MCLDVVGAGQEKNWEKQWGCTQPLAGRGGTPVHERHSFLIWGVYAIWVQVFELLKDFIFADQHVAIFLRFYFIHNLSAQSSCCHGFCGKLRQNCALIIAGSDKGCQDGATWSHRYLYCLASLSSCGKLAHHNWKSSSLLALHIQHGPLIGVCWEKSWAGRNHIWRTEKMYRKEKRIGSKIQSCKKRKGSSWRRKSLLSMQNH